MFTVSCYAFHPLIQRFVRLWKYVQLVSDVITYVLAMICCQCGDAMPLSSSASVESKPSVQAFEAYVSNRRQNQVDLRRLSGGEPVEAQHLVIDFTPGREDTPEIQAKCHELLQFSKNRSELQGMTEQPSQNSPYLINSSDPVHPEIVIEPRDNNNSLPAVHMKKNNKKGVVTGGLQTGGVVNKCCV